MGIEFITDIYGHLHIRPHGLRPLSCPLLQGLEMGGALHKSEIEGLVIAQNNEEVLEYLARFYKLN